MKTIKTILVLLFIANVILNIYWLNWNAVLGWGAACWYAIDVLKKPVEK